MLLNLFNSFAEDEGSVSNSDLDFLATTQTLSNLGLLPTPSLRQVVLVSSKRSFKVSLPQILETNFERNAQEQGLQIPFFVERLKSIAKKFKSKSRHLLVIDGLDDILTSRKVQYDSLAALILEVSRLNLMFRQSNTPAKIILLCRTDLFERLPGGNKNKVRQDSAILLDWYHDTRNPEESNLIELINLKARVTDPKILDIFSTYFPFTISYQYPQRIVESDVRTFLLDLTRHTPRDFIQILTHIQKFSGQKEIKLTRDQILNGVRSYSLNYFVPEIKDELVGYIPTDDVDSAISLIGSLRRRDFKFSELEAKAAESSRFSHLKLPDIIDALFECSGIGNLHNRPGGNTYYTFKFRNRNATLSAPEC